MKKAIIVCIGLAGVLLIWLLDTSGEYYRTYSPDKQYSVYSKKYNWESIIPRSPGGGSDASGKVFLYDEVKKELLAQAKISIIGNTSSINWDDSQAYYTGEAYPNSLKPWKLPRPVKSYYQKAEEHDGLKTTRTYSGDDRLMSEETQQMVIGGWKTISLKNYESDGSLRQQVETRYAFDSNLTYHTTPYVAHFKEYRNGKLIEERFEQAACDECEVTPCNSRVNYDGKDGILQKQRFENCRF